MLRSHPLQLVAQFNCTTLAEAAFSDVGVCLHVTFSTLFVSFTSSDARVFWRPHPSHPGCASSEVKKQLVESLEAQHLHGCQQWRTDVFGLNSARKAFWHRFLVQ